MTPLQSWLLLSPVLIIVTVVAIETVKELIKFIKEEIL